MRACARPFRDRRPASRGSASPPSLRPRRFALALALLLIVAVNAWTQEPQLRLTAEPEHLGLEDTFTVTVALSGADGAGEPQLELGQNFRIVASGRSHSVSFVNGRTSVQTRYEFTVQPLREGIFDVGPATVAWEQRQLRSATARVQVVQGSVAAQPRGGRGAWPFFGEMERRPARQAGKVRIVVALDKSQVYVGEQVTYSVKLLTQQTVQSVKPRSEPALTGLWAEPLTVPNPPVAQRVMDGSEPFTSFLLKQTALFPTAPGTVKLEPTIWDIQVVVSDFLFGQTVELARSSDPLDLRVLPLPEKGKPAGFSGAVGDLTIAATLDKTEAKVNEALLLRVTLSGGGNLKTLAAPELPPLADFRFYNSTSSEASGPKKGKLLGSRTWEFALVAKAPGTHTVPPLEYAFFDPARKEYRTVSTPPLTIEVNKAPGEPDSVGGGAPEPEGSRRAVEPVRRDIAYLKTAVDRLGPRPPPLYRSRTLAALLALPVLANVGALLYGWGLRRERADAPGARRRGARKAAERRLREAARSLEAGRIEEFASRLSEALRGYFADRFDEPRAGLVSERIEELLARAGLGSRAAEIRDLLQRADELRFTPSGGDRAQLRQLLVRARERLVAVDRQLGRGNRT